METVSKHVVDSMQTLHTDLISNSKRSKIKPSTLRGNYSHRGLKDTNLTSKSEFLKLSWIKQLRDTSDFHTWEWWAYMILETVGGSRICSTLIYHCAKITEQKIEKLNKACVDTICIFILFEKLRSWTAMISCHNICGIMYLYWEGIHQFRTSTFLLKQ